MSGSGPEARIDEMKGSVLGMNGSLSETRLEEEQQGVSALTRDAFALLLHHSAEDAYHAWEDGMLMVEGGWVAVTPTSVSGCCIDGSEAGLMISVEAGFSLNESAATKRLMELSGYLLATYGTAVGCTPSGRLTLQRVVVGRLATSASLADDIVATRRLQRLLNEPYFGSDQ